MLECGMKLLRLSHHFLCVSHTPCDISLLFWALGPGCNGRWPLPQVFVEPRRLTQEVAPRERARSAAGPLPCRHYGYSLTRCAAHPSPVSWPQHLNTREAFILGNI